MPIDSKSYSTNVATGYTTNNFSQSNSFHSLRLSSSQSLSSSAKFIVSGSKSSNCLSNDDELIENDELIDKLFPKCRPKSKVTSPSAVAKLDNKLGYVKKLALIEPNNSNPNNSKNSRLVNNREMLNASDVSNSSSSSAAAASNNITNITNNSDVIINGTNYADSSTSASVNTATRKNFQRLQTRRIWNFMDISPSPSPPPLSPIEDSYDTVNSHNTFTSANCLTSDSMGDKYLLYQPPPAPPAETSAEPKLNVTNHIQDTNNSSSSSSQNYNNYANRNSFKMKGKFDINSLELNQTTTATSTTAVKNAAPEVVPAANVIKRSYSNLNNEPQDVHNVRQPSIVNHKQAGAHFRLDSLLLSPDECADVSGGSSRLSNGIKKANRFTLDYDLNDEDDVLFSRLNHPSTAVSSAIGFNLPLLHQVSKQYSSNNKEINNSYPLGDKSNELASTSTSSSSTMTKKSSGQDLTKLKSKLSYNEMDECRSIDFNNKSVTTKVNTEAAVVADDNDEDVETCRDLSINGNRLNDNNFNRNRIELAGGKEIFSSSRSTRAKRRSNCHNSGSQPQGSGLSGTTSAPSTSTGTNQSVNQRNSGGYCQRQIQLYSVSMATTPSAASATAVNATSANSDMDANVNNVNNNNSQLQGQLTETAVAQLQSTLVTAAADNDDIACCDGSEEKQVLDIIADSNKYNTYSAKVIDSKVHSANNSQFPVVVKTTPKEEINELDNNNDNSSFRPKELKNLQQQQQRLLQKVCPPTEINRDQSIESNDYSSTTTATVISGDSLHFNASIAMENKINYSSQPNKSTSKPIFGEDDSVEDENEDDDEDEDDGGVEDEDDDHDVAAAGGDRAFKSKLYNEIDYEESLIREIDEVLEKPSFLRQFTLSSVSTENANLPKDSDLEIVNNNNKKQPCIRKQEQDNKSSLNYSTDPFIRDLHQKLDMVSTINNKNNNNSSQTIVEQKSFANVESEKVESEMETEIESDNNSIKSISLSQKSFDADERIARVIGSVPIAQYEGSPKRYGPKPGYPRRVLSTSSATDSHDYETIPINKSDLLCADEIQPKSLSPENGSPNSTSSSSSATFSSTDIHSSSSFSCPNQKYNGFSNWNIQSRINENRYDDRPPPPPNDDCNSVCDEECKQSQSRSAQRKDSIVMNQGKISCDDIVKSILSIPSGHQVDTEDDGDDNLTTIPGLAKSSHSQSQIEPVYSSLNFIQDQIRPSECDLRYSTTTTTTTNNPNSKLHSCLTDEKQTVNSATATTTASSNGCDQSTTSLKATNFYQNDLSSGERVVTQVDSSNKQQPPPPNSISNSTSMDRNIPKSLALSNYSRYSQASQSFESTDSSYRSEKYNSKEYYYANSEEEDTYIYDQKNYPMKQTPVGTNNNTNANNNSGSRLNGDPNKSSTQTGLIGYSCLSPELNANNAQSMPKMFTDLTYESPGYHSSDQGEIYSDSLANEKSDSASVPGGGVRLVSTMPVLEDGLSSGMPSSDEMDYDDEDDDGDDLARHEHDLDDYVKEYNNNRQTVSGCDTSVQAANRLLNMVNGTGSGYGYQLKGDKSDNTNNQHSSSYRCATKDQYGHELAEDIVHQASHHHSHLNPHVHNHPILGETLRQNLSPYENNSKPDLATSSGSSSSGQDVANISNYNKFCLSSQLRSSSLSNTSSNTSSVSTVRNNSSHLGQQNDAKPPSHGSTSQDSVGLSPQHSHHHYHHYYHQQQQQQQHSNSSQANSNRHNYPNLSSSPTSMSPNSPGTLQPINASSGSSGSSSSSSHIPPSVLSQHHPPPPPPPPPQPPNSSKSAASSSQIPSQSTEMPVTNSPSSSAVPGTAAPNVRHHHDEDCDTDQETDRLLGAQRNDERGFYENEKTPVKRSSTSREGFEPQVLIEGVLFRARYLGSTQLVCDGQPTKATRMMQAEEAVSRIKAPEGETQPSTEVDLFISTEKIMVLNTDLKEIMMDHALRTISYIADIGDLLVLMARRRTPLDDPTDTGIKRIPKMICHVFESEEAQYIAQSIGQAFQVAYMEFLKANGIEDSSFLKEMDYQEVLNSQEIFGNELEMFAKRERQKEVIVPKQKGEILGIVIVESGWGSMLPTVVIANMAQSSPSARCGQLNIGDQIIAINGISLVGLPLSTCQAYVKNTKNQTAVKFTIVPCAPVVEVKIKRPDTKYQLGFSVQNGVICSLLRGGIAERGGVRVGHRIIEINGQSVVAVPHDRIVNLLATSVGEIHMKTMPTSMFRLLTGQESPSFM